MKLILMSAMLIFLGACSSYNTREIASKEMEPKDWSKHFDKKSFENKP